MPRQCAVRDARPRRGARAGGERVLPAPARPVGRGRFHARQHHLPGERLSLNFIEYGAKTLIAPGELRDFYLLQIPLRKGAAIAHGTRRYYSHAERAALLNPHQATTMIWEEGCEQLLVRIDRAAMQAHLEAQIGDLAAPPLTFDGPLDATGGTGAALVRLVRYLVDEADRGTPTLGGGSLMARQIEGALMTGLLEAPGHNYVHRLGREARAAPPRHVRQAEEYMRAHLDRPLTVEDVAAAVGVSARTLQIGFRTHRQSTPMAFLRDARLEQAHRELLSPDPATSVTDVATRWGFNHFGRFAGVYRQRFGCTPRETLHAARSGAFGE